MITLTRIALNTPITQPIITIQMLSGQVALNLVETSAFGEFVTKREEDQYVFAPVLKADEKDKQGEIYSGREVEKAAWFFARAGMRFGIEHREIASTEDAQYVENFVYRPEYNGPTFKVGDREFTTTTWFAGALLGDEYWRKVKKGEWTGLSIGGLTRRTLEYF